MRRAALWCVPVFLAGRLLVSLVSGLAFWVPEGTATPTTRWQPSHTTSFWDGAFSGLDRWDALWYLQIAKHGYAPGDPSSAFFPLYPLLVRGVAPLCGGHLLLAAILISNLALLISLLLLYRLTTRLFGDRIARVTVLLLVLNPAAFFLYAPYSESLFLCLAVASFTFVESRRWSEAAAMCALATATRSAGIALALALVVRAAVASHGDGTRRQPIRVVVAGAGISGLAVYLGFWAYRGRWNEPLLVQSERFHRETAWPLTTVLQGLRTTVEHLDDPGWLVVEIYAAILLISLALTVWVVRQTRPDYATYTVASLLIPLSLPASTVPFNGMARFAIVLFPLTWGGAVFVARSRACLAAVALVSGSLQVLLTALFASWHGVI